jgi:hypothetical protein
MGSIVGRVAGAARAGIRGGASVQAPTLAVREGVVCAEGAVARGVCRIEHGDRQRGNSMRRIAFLAVLIIAACAAMTMSASAGAALYPECPAIDLNTGCQFLVTVTDTETTVESDSTQGPYEGADDALIGIVNHSSKPISSIPFSAEIELFGFEFDGICAVTGSPAGCVQTPLDTSGTANPEANKPCVNGGAGNCAFKAPEAEPGGLKYPAGVTAVGETATGSDVSGYEGPTSWFTGIGAFRSFPTGTGVVHFGPAIAPGGSSYFSLESPPAGGFGSVSTLGTNLSGGGQVGPSISVVQGTPVTDSAVLSGENSTTASGTVSFNAYSDAACKTLAAAAGAAKMVGGNAGPSTAVNLPPGKYFWQAVYGGNLEHQAVASACGTEILTVTTPTTTSTVQSAGGVSAASLAVPKGTGVTDRAVIAGAQAKVATGSVSYALYSDSKCTKLVGAPSAGAVAGGIAAPSAPVKPVVGTYYWVATYGGDALNAPSASKCGSEKLVVALKANVGLPSTKICLSRRKFIAHPRAPKGVKLTRVEVFINGRLKSKGSLTKRHTTINLIGLPKGTFKVAMLVTASNGKQYEDVRTFKTCVPRHHKKK